MKLLDRRIFKSLKRVFLTVHISSLTWNRVLIMNFAWNYKKTFIKTRKIKKARRKSNGICVFCINIQFNPLLSKRLEAKPLFVMLGVEVASRIVLQQVFSNSLLAPESVCIVKSFVKQLAVAQITIRYSSTGHFSCILRSLDLWTEIFIT